MKKTDLIQFAKDALATGRVGGIVLMIHMPGGETEVIQNPNVEDKLKYLGTAYNDELVHNGNSDIWIEDFGIIFKDDQMDFGTAIMNLKAGHRVSRNGWNGKGMFLYYVPAAAYPPCTEVAKTAFGGEDVPYGAYIAMKTAQGNVVPWLASQTDMLAEDWYVVMD